MLAANFPQPADRNWLRLFVQSLQDERHSLLSRVLDRRASSARRGVRAP